VRLRLTAHAEHELAAALIFLRTVNRPAALALARRFDAAFSRIRRFPRMGRLDSSVAEPELRAVRVSPYSVTYRSDADIVLVVAIRHERRLPGME
jgi:plasmid stabilization system protein ParE